MSIAETFPTHGTAVHLVGGPTLDDVRSWPATVDVRRACLALGVSTSWGYQLIAENDFPVRTIRIRNRTRVPTSALLELLGGSS